MFKRKLITTLALLAAMAGISTFAATANAAVVDTEEFLLDSDEVDLTGAVLSFDFSNGEATPKLTGTLEALDAEDTNVRVRIDSYNDGVYLNTEYGNAMFVPDDLFHDWWVNRPGISNPLTDEAVVAVEQETVNGWATQEEQSFNMNTWTDTFRVLRQGVDIGGLGFAGGEPIANASVSWPIDEGLVTPEFDMRLHMDNLGGTCGRIKVRYLTDSGAFLDSGASTDHCPGGNAHRSWAADIPPYTSGLIGQVEVVAQTRAGGQWNDVGAPTTLSIEE